MGIKLTLKDLLEAKPALEKLATQEIGIVQSFKLAKIIRILNEHYKDYDDQRISLIRKLGEQDGDSGNFSIKDESKKLEFVREIEKLLLVEVELEFEPLVLSEFEGAKLSSTEALGLIKLFKNI
jgi:hypothetical protein